MLRSLLIYLSNAYWANLIVTKSRVARKMASRFIAGESKDDAINAVRELNSRGIRSTLDHLGESVTDPSMAREATKEIIDILEAIDEAGVISSVSIKLSQIGLVLGSDIYERNLRAILNKAQELENFIRIDMEDSRYTDATISIYQRFKHEGYANNLGIVIQAYLYRSAEDVFHLMEDGSAVRLCKGAYKEPADIAFTKKSNVDKNFDVLAEMLIWGALITEDNYQSQSGRFPPIPAIATHDEKRINFSKAFAESVGLPKAALEFQMLAGIRRDLQESLVAEGYPVRVYVPYGTEWYPYFMRRLAERPANLWFFLSNLAKN